MLTPLQVLAHSFLLVCIHLNPQRILLLHDRAQGFCLVLVTLHFIMQLRLELGSVLRLDLLLHLAVPLLGISKSSLVLFFFKLDHLLLLLLGAADLLSDFLPAFNNTFKRLFGLLVCSVGD